jgi:hypothetical protein
MASMKEYDFAKQLKGFAVKQERMTRTLFLNTASAVFDSIVNGSSITGAPGQPVGQYGPGYHPGKVGGTLKASWQLVFVTATQAIIGTKLVYAPPIEEGTNQGRKLTLRSTVGGFHSVAKTITGYSRLVDAEAVKAQTKSTDTRPRDDRGRFL